MSYQLLWADWCKLISVSQVRECSFASWPTYCQLILLNKKQKALCDLIVRVTNNLDSPKARFVYVILCAFVALDLEVGALRESRACFYTGPSAARVRALELCTRHVGQRCACAASWNLQVAPLETINKFKFKKLAKTLDSNQLIEFNQLMNPKQV